MYIASQFSPFSSSASKLLPKGIRAAADSYQMGITLSTASVCEGLTVPTLGINWVQKSISSLPLLEEWVVQKGL